MNKVLTNSMAIEAKEPISLEAIHKAIYKFRYETPDNPEEIEISPNGKAELLKHTESKYMYTINLDSIMGLKIKVNPELADDEWRIIKTVSKTYATHGE